MTNFERRKFRRIGKKLDICCSEIGSVEKRNCIGRTVNVSTGGLYFQATTELFMTGNLSPGSLVNVELSIPPTKGQLEFGGKISSIAKVLRTSNYDPQQPESFGVALEFCQTPEICI